MNTTKNQSSKNELELTLNELSLLSGEISNTKNTKELNSGSFLALIELQEEIRRNIENFQKARIDIIKAFDIKPTKEGNYNWNEHKEKEKINEKLTELQEQKFKVKTLNFMEVEEFRFFTLEKEFNVIPLLKRYLVKTNGKV